MENPGGRDRDRRLPLVFLTVFSEIGESPQPKRRSFQKLGIPHSPKGPSFSRLGIPHCSFQLFFSGSGIPHCSFQLFFSGSGIPQTRERRSESSMGLSDYRHSQPREIHPSSMMGRLSTPLSRRMSRNELKAELHKRPASGHGEPWQSRPRSPRPGPASRESRSTVRSECWRMRSD